jgi:hypothetical protein
MDQPEGFEDDGCRGWNEKAAKFAFDGYNKVWRISQDGMAATEL